MFINKSGSDMLNICGANIAFLRKQMKMSQRALADQMQLFGIDMTKNTIQRIESGKRFVIDLELKRFAEFFNVATDYLLK